jgi:hypothetical protein
MQNQYEFGSFGLFYYCRWKGIVMYSAPFTISGVNFCKRFEEEGDYNVPEQIKNKFIKYTKDPYFEIDLKRWSENNK